MLSGALYPAPTHRILRRAVDLPVPRQCTKVVDADEVKRRARSRIPDIAGVRLEYLEVVDPGTFQPIARVSGAAVIAGALWVGTTRLIDNVRWEA